MPRQQYDDLKAKFIENETAAKKRLESIDDLEAKVQRREDQLMEMDRVFQEKMEAMEEKLLK